MTPDRQIAVVVFGVLALIMFVYFMRVYLARRRRIREGRDVDIGRLILFGSKAGEGNRTVLKTDRRIPPGPAAKPPAPEPSRDDP